MPANRASHRPKRRPSGKTRAATSLEIIRDSEGSVAFGWVSEGVVYARIAGGLSAAVGMELAARLQACVERVDSLAYFADASEMTHYDLLARSGFVRVVLASRRKFAQLAILTWSQGTT